MNRVVVIVLFIVAIAGSAVYVAAGADTFLFGADYPQARERLKLVFAGLGALAAPISLWVALTAYRLSSQLASMNATARLDRVPESTAHMDDERQVQLPGGGGETDLSACEIEILAKSGDASLYCAVPLINLGPAQATIVSSTASLSGVAAQHQLVSASVAAAQEVIFLSFAWDGAAAQAATAEPHLEVVYADGIGRRVQLTGEIRAAGADRWRLENLGQKPA